MIASALEAAGYRVEAVTAGDDEGMRKFEVYPPGSGTDLVQVQVAHFAFGETVATDVGPAVTLDYPAARKAVAVMERHRARDYVDIASLAGAGYTIGQLLEMAFTKAPYLEMTDAGDAGVHLDLVTDGRLARELPPWKTPGWVRDALAGWPREPVHDS